MAAASMFLCKLPNHSLQKLFFFFFTSSSSSCLNSIQFGFFRNNKLKLQKNIPSSFHQLSVLIFQSKHQELNSPLRCSLLFFAARILEL